VNWLADFEALVGLARTWSAVAARLEDRETRELSHTVAVALANPLRSVAVPEVRLAFAEALSAVLDRLEEPEAHTSAAAAADVLTGHVPSWTFPSFADHAPAFFAALAAVSAKLDEAEAERAASRLTERLANRPLFKPTEVVDLARAWAALAERAGKQKAAALAPAAAAALSGQMGRADSPSSPDLAEAWAFVAPHLSDQGVVDPLKDPFCTGPIRAVLLRELGRRFGQRFDSSWDLANWVQQHEPKLDLSGPPRRPGP
jgi:hypothetical protein